MHRKRSYKSYPLLAMLMLAAMAPATQAASITQTYSGSLPVTLTGMLPDQGTALEQTFTLTAPGNLTISTSSYAMGGFQTNLLLFNGAGNFITAGVPAGMPDPMTGLIGDTTLMASGLPAGTYIIALTDFLLNQSFTATNLSDGFTANYGNGTMFVDSNGNTRTADYTLSIGTPAAVPEPSSLWLAAPALAWLGLRRRTRTS